MMSAVQNRANEDGIRGVGGIRGNEQPTTYVFSMDVQRSTPPASTTIERLTGKARGTLRIASSTVEYAKWYTKRFQAIIPEWYVFPSRVGRPELGMKRPLDPTRGRWLRQDFMDAGRAFLSSTFVTNSMLAAIAVFTASCWWARLDASSPCAGTGPAL